MKITFILILTALLSACGDSRTGQMLVIGDSISLGYTPYLKISNTTITHDWDEIGNHGNADATPYGLNMIDEWLAGNDWDVVTFNWGIHDLGLVNGVGPETNTSLTDYKKNLTILAKKIQAKSRRCYFITTTDIPKGIPVGDTAAFRLVALEIMGALKIPVIDLLPVSESVASDHINEEHYNQAGYEKLAAYISAELDGSRK